MSNVVLSAVDICKEYNEGVSALRIFDHINFQLLESQTVSIVGKSGAGKTTLLNILGGLDKPSAGVVLFQGEDIHRMKESRRCRLRNQHVGFVYQFHHLLAEFTALENVAMPLLIAGTGRHKERASTLLERVGLGDRLNHKPAELSGGERQRVAIARSLVCDPKVVLMDEPTGNLDESTAESVQEIIFELANDIKTAFVIVTHDTRMAQKMGQTYVLESGSLHTL